MMIPAEALESIRSKLDIVELVSEYVPQMQRAGRNMKARCPFHQERTPSFIVSPERQTFHCFGCGVGGDAFAFLMKIENLSFTEAAEKLAGKAGVKLAIAEDALGPEQKERLKIKEVLELAADYYHRVLISSAAGEAARRYLEGRRVSSESIEAWQLGYAPKSSALVQAAQKKGHSKELLVRAGLAAPAKGSGRLRDYFYDRVLYPIRDARGAVVGFGGRTLGEGEPKYLNSPDSPVFSKGRVLYGLFQGLAAVRKERRVLLMEGYMDVMAAHQYGFVTSSAPLGTALTQDHAALIKRYASEAVLVFDADSAGANASIRNAELLLAAGLSVRIATVPGGKDPDEHLHKSGADSFRKCLEEATDLADFKTGLLLARHSGPLTPEAKSQIARGVLAAIEQCPDEILKSEWIRRLANRLGVEEQALLRQNGKTASASARPSSRSAPARAAEPAALPEQDVLLLGPLLRRPSLSRLLREEELASAAGRRIWAALCALKEGPAQWEPRLLEALSETDQALVSRLLVDDKPDDEPEKVLTGILESRRGLKRLLEIEPIVKEIGAGQRAKDPAIQEEYARLVLTTRSHRGGR